MIYLDTSVLASLYWEELLSAKVQKIVASTGPPAVSKIGEVELISAAARRVRMRELSRDDALRIASQFESNLSEGSFERVAIEPADYDQARDLIVRFDTNLRTLDALHLAVVRRRKLPILTADKTLAKAAEKFDVQIVLVEL